MFKKSIIIILITICAIVVASVLAYAFFIKPEPDISVQPAVNNNDDVKDEINENDITKNWKVYRNEEYGFEVKYPKDWYSQTTSTFLIETGKSHLLAIISSHDSDIIHEVLDKGIVIDIMMVDNIRHL
jgi:capsular polysaccharide biosynthesis protein